jgi:SAM-dependent methyltransferase
MTSPDDTTPVSESGNDPNVEPFSADAVSNDGYIYTTNASLSSRLANRRMTDVSLEIAEFRAKRVIDIGCGDGTYGREILDLAGPALILGIDPAEEAVEIARRKASDPRLVFSVSSAYSLPCPDDSFDVAYLRGVLHHMDQPVDALREALRVAPVVVVIEPNGYNPGLKVIERCSKYHVEHGEKSYAPRALDRWVTELGGRVRTRRWVCLVPMFSPDWMARPLKRLEPALERLPVLRAVGCGTYAFTIVR